MKRLSGFSLMEMMTVLLIVSVVAAASAPMINKRMMVNQAVGDCVWEQIGGSIFYNRNADNSSVIIGADTTNNNLSPKLHIRTIDGDPFITFERDGVDNQLALRYGENTVGLSNIAPSNGATAVGVIAGAGENSTVIGNNAGAAANGTALGSSAIANGRCIAIGNGTIASNVNSLAIGSSFINPDTEESNITQASGEHSIAIGSNATATRDNTIAVGTSTNISGLRGIAVGNNINSSGVNAVTIGNDINVTTDPQRKDIIAIGRNIQANKYGIIAIGRNIATTQINEPQNSIILSSLDDKYSVQTWRNAVAISTGISDNRDIDKDENGIKNIRLGGYSISIGYDAYGTGTSATAVGPHTTASKENATAIGRKAEATGKNSIAIGNGAIASANCSLAIGSAYLGKDNLNRDIFIHMPKALHENSVAIGRGARTTSKNEIVLGSAGGKIDSYTLEKTTVSIPGILSANDTQTQSDRRLKNVGKAFTSGLAEIKKLEAFNYTFKKDESKTPRVGVMAQDLQKIFPNAVTKGEDGFLRIRMEDMFYAVVNAVKELANMFDRQDERIVQLEKENKELHKTINDLEKRLEKLEKQK